MNPALGLLRREIAIAWGRGGGLMVTGGFFAGATLLLPLASGPEPERLAQIAPGAAWTSSMSTPPQSLGWQKLTREPAVPTWAVS